MPALGFWRWRASRPSVAGEVFVVSLPGVDVVPIVDAATASERYWQLTGSFDALEDGRVVVSEGEQLFDACTGMPLLGEPREGIDEMCAVGNGVLAVCGDRLCALRDSELAPILRLPAAGFRPIGAGARDRVFLLNERAEVFQLAEGVSTKILALDAPVRDVAVDGPRLYLATGTRILAWSPGSDAVTLLDWSEHSTPIRSLAVDPESGVLYFAAGDGVFAYVDGVSFLVLAGISGELAFTQQILLVEDRLQRALFAVSGAREAIADECRRARALQGSS